MPEDNQQENGTAVPSTSPNASGFVSQSNLDAVKSEFTTAIGKTAEDFTRRIEERESKTTEILAIFIALFTFISVSISIFTRVEDLATAAWFIILITACITILVSILIILIGRDKKENMAIFFLVFAFVILGFLLFAPGNIISNPKLNPPDNSKAIINIK